MNDILPLIMAGIAGLLLGVLFFGGLWLTVCRGTVSERPALWFFGSFILRMSAALSGIYLVSGGHWPRMLSCLFGFALGRFIVMRLPRLPGEGQRSLATGGSHAP